MGGLGGFLRVLYARAHAHTCEKMTRKNLPILPILPSPDNSMSYKNAILPKMGGLGGCAWRSVVAGFFVLVRAGGFGKVGDALR